MNQPEPSQAETTNLEISKLPWATLDFFDKPPATIAVLFTWTLIICILICLAYGSFAEITWQIESEGSLSSKQGEILTTFYLSDRDLSSISIGDEVRLYPKLNPELVASGKISSINKDQNFSKKPNLITIVIGSEFKSRLPFHANPLPVRVELGTKRESLIRRGFARLVGL